VISEKTDVLMALLHDSTPHIYLRTITSLSTITIRVFMVSKLSMAVHCTAGVESYLI
jgi:hypothetical protein